MFSLLLSICISTANFNVCEVQEIDYNLTFNDCLEQMEFQMHELNGSSVAKFEWELQCSPNELTNVE